MKIVKREGNYLYLAPGTSLYCPLSSNKRCEVNCAWFDIEEFLCGADCIKKYILCKNERIAELTEENRQNY
jgi:hypothetical protein